MLGLAREEGGSGLSGFRQVMSIHCENAEGASPPADESAAESAAIVPSDTDGASRVHIASKWLQNGLKAPAASKHTQLMEPC